MTDRTAPRLTHRLMHSAAILPLTMILALGGCASPKKVDPATTGSISQPMTQEEFEQAVTYWGQRYAAEPKSREVALNYAGALRRTNRADQAVAVLQKAVIYYPEDRDVLAAYGKALATAGDLERALGAIRRAQTPDRPDWQLASAEAAILDQMGNHADARRLYAQALDLKPDEPSVLSNFGMSYTLTGELPEAEKLLRKAMATPGADSRVRQNLALVVGLQGRFDEAEQIAGAEISPQQAKANIAYLKDMLAQRNTWQALQSGGKAKPNSSKG